MSRSLTVGALLLIAAVSIGLYQLSYMVRGLEGELIDLNRALRQDREAIQVLHAEWAYLSRPEALQQESDRYLHLVPLLPKQIITEPQIADLPDAGEFAVPLPLPRPGRPAAADVPLASLAPRGPASHGIPHRALVRAPDPVPPAVAMPPTLRPVMANAFALPR